MKLYGQDDWGVFLVFDRDRSQPDYSPPIIITKIVTGPVAVTVDITGFNHAFG